LLLENVRRGFVGRLLAFDLLGAGVLLEDRRAGKAEQLGVGEEFLDGFVFSPNCERWHSSKMKTMRCWRSGSRRSL
jgi:hypothetical protein